MNPCQVPGHAKGSRPYAVPVLGNRDRVVPVYVVCHGREYLDADGAVTRFPVWLTWGQAAAAISTHADAEMPSKETP